MASNDKKKYYWLKLEEDFFKRHDTRILESMPNGKDYLIFYLKLLCESTSHEGLLRFSDAIPYNADMLSVITNTNVDTVRNAIKVLGELNLLRILDDGTLYMEQVEKMLGCETGSAIRKREYRAQLESNSIPLIEEPKEKKPKFKKPTIEEVTDYCRERNNNVDPQKWLDYYESNGFMIGRSHMKDWKACVRNWERNSTHTNVSSEDSLPKYDDSNNVKVDRERLAEILRSRG